MTESETLEQRWSRFATAIGETHDADVILYSGDIDDANADALIRIAKQPTRRTNVMLMLATRGGSPDAAYRMARCLQRQYAKFTLYIYGVCKSAGTLVALGANEIVLSDFGEFGPLDIQLGKRDELFETVSGLNITQALNSLGTRATNLFLSTLVELRQSSKGQITTKLAAEIASNLAIGLYEKIYNQIDPSQLGSIERSINIASDYGQRLQSSNVKPLTVDKLVSGYPSHSFVIDISEASDLFVQVRKPDSDEEALAECIPWVTRGPAEKPFAQKLNAEPVNANPDETDSATESGETGEGTGGDENNEAANQSADQPPVETRPHIVK